MRVITGTARGANLFTLEGEEVRPTAQRVKEAMFSVVQFYVAGARVLDLFAGSGQLGIEALSRGASSAVFVDANPDSLVIIRQNLEKTGFSDRAKVVRNDAFRYVSRMAGEFDILFIDPPYYKGLAKKAVRRVADLVSDGGILLAETELNAGMPETAGDLQFIKNYRYGQTSISMYRRKTGEGNAGSKGDEGNKGEE